MAKLNLTELEQYLTLPGGAHDGLPPAGQERGGWIESASVIFSRFGMLMKVDRSIVCPDRNRRLWRNTNSGVGLWSQPHDLGGHSFVEQIRGECQLCGDVLGSFSACPSICD